jgi:succinate dehydrogenase/fumarate reductase flavoprotein subunit
MLSVAHLSAVSALHRTESRGVHYRTDFPERSPEPVTHTLLRPCFEDARIQRVEVKSIPVASGAVPLRS